MAVATFDTLKFANALKAAGVPDKQAEAHAAAFAELIQTNFKELATKDDIAGLKIEIERVARDAKDQLDAVVKDLKRDNAELRTEFKHDIQTLRTDHKADMVLMKWMLGANFAGVLAVITMLARLMFLQSR